VVEEAPHGMTEGAPDKVVQDESVEGVDDDVRRPVSIQTEADIASPEDNFRGTAIIINIHFYLQTCRKVFFASNFVVRRLRLRR
jgi:hypothetical protein